MLIRAVLFDYGGTLVVPKEPDLAMVPTGLNASFKVFERNGLDIGYARFSEYDGEIFGRYAKLEEAQKRDIPDQTKYDELASLVLPRLLAGERRKVAIEARSAFWGVFAENHTLRKGGKSSLMQLKKMGVRMGVVSNNHDADALRAHLRALGILSYFSDITSSEL